jgi:hypothetical protein
MSLLTILITLIIAGILLWLINTYVPMDGKIKKLINIIAIVAIVFWLIKVFGLLKFLSGINF